jgi:hypothetical protein
MPTVVLDSEGTMLLLPELIYLILDILFYHLPTFHRCALVCRTWHAYTLKRLFRDVVLYTWTGCIRLQRLTLKSPNILICIRDLDVVVVIVLLVKKSSICVWPESCLPWRI